MGTEEIARWNEMLALKRGLRRNIGLSLRQT